MTITVIIPVLNEARLIGRTLSRTVALGFDDVIVVDGGGSGCHPRSCNHSRTIAPCPLLLSAMPPHPDYHPPFVVDHQAVPASSMPAPMSLPWRCAAVPACRHPAPGRCHTGHFPSAPDHTAVGGRFNVRFDSDRTMARLVARMMNLDPNGAALPPATRPSSSAGRSLSVSADSRIFRSWKISISRAASNEPDTLFHSPHASSLPSVAGNTTAQSAQLS